ncbi:MAG: GAF domain-containing protein [Balneolaceae bacterium]|nr:GAF domain-containing protein [Balneolaceae bacterium]
MKTADEISYQELIEETRSIVSGEGTRDEKLKRVCSLLEEKVDIFDWVGFYLVDPDSDRELVLGPYVGEETDHTRIPFGKGICGQAANSLETFVVQDVSKEDNYLACSMDVQAEIVIPVMKNNTFVAELDIDSHTKNSLTEGHRTMLEEICDIVARLF